MLQLNLPGDFRPASAKLVPPRLMTALQGRALVTLRPVDQVGTGLINGYRVAGGADADVVDDRGVGVAVAVAGRRYLGYEAEVDGAFFLAGNGAFGVLGHLLHDQLGGFIPLDIDCLDRTDGDAAGAAGTFLRDDRGFAASNNNSIMGAGIQTVSAAGTILPGNLRRYIGMLYQFALAAGAAHSQVLDGPSETGQVVTLEMGKTDQRIGLDDLGADVDLLQQLTIQG